jgi:peptide/nickel transport system substrate-binding protein
MFGQRHRRRLGRLATSGGAIVLAATLAAGCSSGGGTPPGASGGAKIKGGVVTWAELPATVPNWIFPFMTLTYFSVANSQDFQYMMYRPLYWFGGESVQPTVDYGLSVANAPVYTNGGKTIVINLKGWKWSNGETVNAKDVIFWLNMMNAEFSNWAGASPGGIPQNFTSYSATGPDQVTIHLNKAYSSLWFTYNELSQITPMPMAWDVTKLGGAAGSGGCTTDTAADKWAKCVAVYNFLTAQSKNTASYVSSPIWSVTDGPWKLSSFDTSGNVSFVPSPTYSGSPKPTISKFTEVPFTTDTAEYTAVKTGALSIGYIPSQDLPVRTGGSFLPPTNPLGSSYTLAPNFNWGFAYYLINFKNPQFGAEFKQLYIRQALQYVDDQLGMTKAAWRGYAYPTTSAAPAEPAGNQWISSDQMENGGQGPYPFSIAKAKALLSSHGWKMVGGVMTCQSPGTGASQCGAGIAPGAKMSFTLDYSTGVAAFTNEVAVYKSDASQAGINVNVVGKTFNAVAGEAVTTNPSWQGAMYGLWIYSPDYEPTGEAFFATGSGSNGGSYSDPTMDKLIQATETSSSLSAYHTFNNYAAEQLPFIYMPLDYTIQAVNPKLHGVDFNPLQTELPEYYYFTK